MAIIIQIKVTPNAAKNVVMGWEEETLRLRVRGVPEKGRVNEELIEFLAKVLKIAKSQISIESGHNSRIKRIKIEGVSREEFDSKVLLNR